MLAPTIRPLVGASSLTEWANAWMDYVQAQTGISPIIYVNSNYARNYLTGSAIANTRSAIRPPISRSTRTLPDTVSS